MKSITGLEAARRALGRAKSPLSSDEIADRARRIGWRTRGKTPGATLYAAMTREIAAKRGESRFRKVGRGRFSLR